MKCFISNENLLSSKYCYNNISNNTVEYKLKVSAKTDARDICFGIFDNPELDFSNMGKR